MQNRPSFSGEFRTENFEEKGEFEEEFGKAVKAKRLSSANQGSESFAVETFRKVTSKG